MKNNAKISEKAKVNTEILAVTSAAGTTSLNYDMQSYDRALISVALQGTFSTITVDLMESSGATVAGTSAAGSKAGIVAGGGSTLISTSGGAREIALTWTTATTADDTFRLTCDGESKTFKCSNSSAYAESSANTSTLLYYASSVGSSANNGLINRMSNLTSAINSTKGFGTKLICTTISTAAMKIKATDGWEGGIGYQTTVAVPTAAVYEAVVGFDISQDQLDSTANKRYVSAKVSTASTTVRAAFNVIRTGGHFGPPTYPGKLST